MHYCSNCRQITNNSKTEISWNSLLKLIIVHCELCAMFKYQYLKTIGDGDDKSKRISR